MTELSEQEKQAYWRYNIRLTTVLPIIWFVTTYVISGLIDRRLSQFTILGFPPGYSMAVQGSLGMCRKF
jgi:putative solute:sodium symporter small subunit